MTNPLKMVNPIKTVNLRKYPLRKILIGSILGFTLLSFGFWLLASSKSDVLNLRRFAQVLGIEKWMSSPTQGGTYDTLDVPSNDNFANRTVIGSIPASIWGTNIHATMETGSTPP